jgi:hypothetical protein
MKTIFFNLILFLILNSKEELRIPFKRHYNEDLSSLSPKEIIPKIYHSNMEIILEIGSNNQKVPFYIRLDQYGFFTSGSEANINKYLNKFNEKESNTYNNITGKIQFHYQQFSSGYKSNDNIKFPNIKKKQNLNFILVSEMGKIYNESGVIGFKNYHKVYDSQIENYSFLPQLKNLNLIKNLDFVFKFKDKDNGEIIIGEKPHEYSNYYNSEKFITIQTLINEENEIAWGLKFNNISFIDNKGKKNILQNSQLVYLKMELDGIYGPHEYEDLLKDNFNKLISEKKCFSETTLSFKYYYCDKSVNMDFIGNLQFSHKDFKTNFTFNKNDLIYKSKDGFQHFMVFFQLEQRDNYWIFGKLFLEKYQLVFNLESKTIGFYLDGKKSISKSYLFIIFLIIIIFSLVIILYHYIRKIPRKKRPFELEEDFDYTPQLNNEGNKGLLSG